MHQNASAQSLTGDGLVAVQGQIRDHLNAPSAQSRGKGLNDACDVGIGAQQFNAQIARTRCFDESSYRHATLVFEVGGQRDCARAEFVVELVRGAEIEHDTVAKRARGESAQQFGFTLREDNGPVVQCDDAPLDVVDVPGGTYGEASTFSSESHERPRGTRSERARENRCSRQDAFCGRRRVRDVQYAVRFVTDQGDEMTKEIRIRCSQELDGLVNVEEIPALGLAQSIAAPLRHKRERQRGGADERYGDLAALRRRRRFVRNRNRRWLVRGCVSGYCERQHRNDQSREPSTPARAHSPSLAQAPDVSQYLAEKTDPEQGENYQKGANQRPAAFARGLVPLRKHHVGQQSEVEHQRRSVNASAERTSQLAGVSSHVTERLEPIVAMVTWHVVRAAISNCPLTAIVAPAHVRFTVAGALVATFQVPGPRRGTSATANVGLS